MKSLDQPFLNGIDLYKSLASISAESEHENDEDYDDLYDDSERENYDDEEDWEEYRRIRMRDYRELDFSSNDLLSL